MCQFFSQSKADQLDDTVDPENKRQRVEHEGQLTRAERQSPVHKHEGGADNEGPNNEKEGGKTGGEFEVPRHRDARKGEPENKRQRVEHEGQLGDSHEIAF